MAMRLWVAFWTLVDSSFKANYYYRTGLTSIPTDLPYSTVNSTNTHATINFDNTALAAISSGQFAAQFATTLTIATAGLYSFQLDFRDGVRLKVSDINLNDAPKLEVDGVISSTGASLRRSAPWYIEAGNHPLYLEYFSSGSGSARLKLEYQGPDTSDAWEVVCTTSSRCTAMDPIHKPEITIFGAVPSYFLKSSTEYEEPGVQCSGSGQLWDVVVEKPSLSTTGIFYAKYSCEDSYGLTDSDSREVHVRDWQSIVLIGPDPFTILEGDTFTDPQACCLDYSGQSLSWVGYGSVGTASGIYETSYTCVDPLLNSVVTTNRQVIVDSAPTLQLLGDSSVKITKGTGYIDDGVVCQDAEDGLISNVLPDSEEIIQPVGVFTSDSATATARAAVDGNGESSCSNCETVTSGLLRWVELDLGAARTVTEVRLYAPSDGFQVHVATLPWPTQGSSSLYESTTGDCSSVSKWDIWDLHLCERAADLLGVTYSSSSYSSATGTLHGCVYDSSTSTLEIKLGDARSTFASSLASQSAVSSTTLSGTQTRICGPLAPFTQIQDGFCEDIGYQAIRSRVRCGLAAQALGISMGAHSSSASQVAPGGCYQYTTDSSVRINQDQTAKEYVSSSTLASLCQLPGSCVDYYISYSDNDMVSGTSATTQSTWGDCMKSCASSSSCGLWSYDLSSSSCKLYNSGAAGSASADANLISGPAYCQEVPGVPCREELSASTGWSNATCLAPTVGRYVTIWTRRASGDMKLCEAEVRGGLAPRLPKTFYINSGCSGASVAGNFILNGNQGGFPVYHYPQEDVYAVETGKETASFTYDPTAHRWVLSISTGAVAYAYTAATLPAGALVMTAESGTSLKCQQPLVRPDPAESCSWRFGFSQRSGKYECRDGTLCDSDCCSNNGGLYRCPYNLPIMCETATNGLYTCATDCSATGGPRKCQASDSSASSCFASGVSGMSYSTVMTDGTLTESSAEDCQLRCRTTGGCAHFSYYPLSNTNNCKLHDSLAAAASESGTTSGPPTCLAAVTTVDNVNPDQIGFFRVYYLCTDSSGLSVGTSRVVEVGCEGPNPSGIYGGNIVTCETVQSGPAKVNDYLACLKICTADNACETYEFLGFSTNTADGGNCTTWSGCDGVYSEDTNTLRQVGYCQRINHYPKIFVTASDRTVNIGVAYVEGAVTCTDYEDPYPPNPVTVTEFDNNVAGEYFFQYSCTDQIGQTTLGNRTVTVKANCAVPSGINNSADTPCSEGSGPFAHGSTCTPVCKDGYTRSLSLMTCTTTSDSDYQSDWDKGTFICGDSQCDISTVKGSIKNLAESSDGSDVPGCVEGDTIVSGATCTPNCKTAVGTSFIADVTSLACDRGNFTPVTYTCNEVAYVPQYVTYSSRDVDAIVVTWAAGNPSDCGFTNWALEYILVTSNTGETAWADYQANPNCGTTALTAASRTSILSCTANTLAEGSGYKFRVREECSNTDLNGGWQYSEEITTKTLTPPVTIFTLPNDDVYDSPGSIMVAFDQAVVPGMVGRTVELVKSGENCLASADGTYNYTKTTSEISKVSLDGQSGMEIAGSRILIITPPTAYWSGSCVYNVSFQQASIYPDTTGTIKELVAFWFNFTYIEVPPTLSSIIRNDTGTTSTSISYTIMYDRRTQMNCTAAPKDATTCATAQVTQQLSPTASRRCESRNSTSDMIQELDEPMSFTISDLYPNVQYFVTCSGWIPGKFWVPTVDIATTWSSAQTVTTSEDTESGISKFMLTVYAVCTDGSIKQTYQAEMKTSEFELGYTAQIDEWIAACQPGVSLQLSESVNFIFEGTVSTVSENAYVNWEVGPNHTVTYTKPADATESAIVTSYLKFAVQSLSYLQGNTLVTNLQNYQVLVTVVDIGFTFEEVFASSSKVYEMISGLSSVAPMYGSTGDALPTGYEELVLDVGAEMYFKIKVSQTNFDWSEVKLYLKSVTSGYLVSSTYLSANGQIATYQLQHNGQGTQLPFILVWRSAIFVIPIWISFSPPVFSVNVLEASLTAQTTVTVSFSNVPTYVAGTDAFGAPASTMQMYIIKNGYTDNLCGSTTFDKTWNTGTCSLSPGALTDIIIYLKIHNQQLNTFLLVPGDQSAGLANIISYARPNPTEMASDVPNALRNSLLDLGMIVNAHMNSENFTAFQIQPAVSTGDLNVFH